MRNGKARMNGPEPRIVIRTGVPFPGKTRRSRSLIERMLAKLKPGESFHIHRSLKRGSVAQTIVKAHKREPKKRYSIGRERGGHGVWRNA